MAIQSWYPEALIAACLLLASAAAHRVVDSAEDTEPPGVNTTTLFPVQPIRTPEKNSTVSKQKTATSWKIETTFGESKLDSNSTDSKEQVVLERPSNGSQEFKASPHVGNYVDDEGFDFVPTKATPGAFGVLKKPPSGFISFPKEHKSSKEVFKHFHKYPYSVETPIITKAKDDWRPVSSLDSKPTDESPVRVPAGGLYKHPLPDPFKVKPGTTDEDFGLEFDHKEHPVKKRMNPMKNLLHLLTALIPVGIIFSALTPTLITIEPDQSGGTNVFRRADGSFASIPQISERCRRRLLCELQSEANYRQSGTNRNMKQCNRIRCEDPETLTKTLQWLLSHSPTAGHGHSTDGNYQHPNDGHITQRPNRPTDGHIQGSNYRPTGGNIQGPSNYRPTSGHIKTDGYRPGNIAHNKQRPDEDYGSKYGSYRPGATGDQFNADFT
ncbi:hypothetical protein NE865_09170 [Phthorimaea operculella]|nr:hypothetical protein NE865_09170 [Phthorimaea operculella]